jgi:bifunctional ADP-heptose synthase (sugar kinase/adenylyltransferase)
VVPLPEREGVTPTGTVAGTHQGHAHVQPTDELVEYLGELRTRFGFDDVLRYLDGAQPLRVLTIGEAIVDEYQYVETIGKSGKEPILAARYLSDERFAGGILAVANQLAAAADAVVALTFLGGRDSHEDFIRASLEPNVRLEVVFNPDAPTIVKRRFVETYPFQKLFELYVIDGHAEDESDQAALCTRLEELLPAADLAVVADYGHGLLREQAVELLCSQAPYLAVNTQVNADNRGFNTISKYRSADFVALSEQELRLEVRNRHRDLREIVLEVAEELGCRRMIVTRGARGCIAYGAENGYQEIPGFVTQVVDRVGAGDAVLAFGSLLAVQGAPSELIGLVGNVVGASAVGIVGNRSSVGRETVVDRLRQLLA